MIKGNKKILSLVLSIIFGISILFTVGCSSHKSEDDVNKTYDEEFLDALEKSIENRHELASSNTNFDNYTDSDYQKFYINLVKSETNIIYEYENKEFKDSRLKKLATQYIDGLKKQEEATQYYITDFIKFNQIWEEGLKERSMSLMDIKNEYEIKIKDEVVYELNQWAKQGNEENEFENELDKILNNIKFELDKNDYGWKYYSTIQENTTNKDITYINMVIKLKDENGITIEEQYIYLDSWKKGEKVKMEFSTEKEFVDTEITVDYSYE